MDETARCQASDDVDGGPSEATGAHLTICMRCWGVIAIDGENNLARAATPCSHLGPFMQAVEAR
jgi:hypothetical protein